jgi:hypothetical protein
MPDSLQHFTAQDWDEVRAAFASSLLIDTSLHSLAVNLDGPDWPIHTASETPAAYIDLDFEELQELLALKGQPAERVDLLIGLLKETLAFDEPFGEMAQQTELSARRDNPLLKNLERLEIPPAFPIGLTTLNADTLEFCRLEQLKTLGEFAVFAQSMAQNVIVAGEFRGLLNALSHVDETALAAYLPFRPGSRGLHLAEALAQAAKSAAPQVRVVQVLAWFEAEFAAFGRDLATDGSLYRHLHVLHDLETERRVTELLQPHLPLLAGRPSAERGMFRTLTRLFKR